ncbi:MAG: heavy-metal-associated domain-containing protein [Candidatus Marinimicrobia bacterium]|jgi:copper chaperone CopZ|nr:heavy-metal-associated domain-containing protein [Candidatus Neomarinimicrobiota bacterium]MBT3501811.1 heavy-metal-associated domain-containing protein [Candidatus Neomarinimicrobiota bacterium]MBT3838495.1 heavy-metal-associated domain-containing protein [Candidatus Neomarinimicrobiota bacterium]MBT3999580.1 heavy-metal-associated domain-containing protein [Candidatus Neomarinimicrobiota bacterium]MBT4283353.1 heavy-metal-associated domain-containing protein [Candidatus Neomarinimicrobiota
MKKIIIFTVSALLLGVMACSKGEAKQADIALSTIQCGMCESTIERGMSKIKGITNFDVDLKTKTGRVNFDAAVIDMAAIEKAISDLGYQANNTIADPVAYEGLAPCCKIGGMSH